MSLATRCTSCGTVFRVVQDQLKVSSGWVRCGRCGEVFNAIESLVEAPPERPDSAPVASAHGSRVMAELARVAATEATVVGPVDGLADPPQPAADAPEAVGPGEAVPAVAPSTETPMRAAPAPDDGAAEPRAVELAADPVPSEMPSFVHQATRAARWRHPAVRASLALVALGAAVTLVVQMVASHHDWLAARWPMLQPAVSRLCGLSDCVVRAPRQLDALSVESSSLLRHRSDAHYVLNVSLRNRAAWRVRMPALDLVLSDAAGRAAVRRVLTPQDLGLGPDAPAIDGGDGVVLSARIRVQGQPILGYTVELFYP